MNRIRASWISLAALVGLTLAASTLLRHRGVDSDSKAAVDPATPNTSDLIEGRVVAQGSPVPNAEVRFAGASFATKTDALGRFRLRNVAGSRPIVASAAGHYIAHFETPSKCGGDSVEIALTPLPHSRVDSDYDWVSPHLNPGDGQPHCAQCHPQLYRDWLGGAHAQSAVNPFFWGLIEGPVESKEAAPKAFEWSLRRDHPHGVGVCASCHVPTAPLNLAEFSQKNLTGAALDGVHCDACHKVESMAEGKPGLAHGRFAWNWRLPDDGEQLFFGPLPDALGADNAHSPVYSSSRYCAACHEGVVFGVRVYGTFSEWLRSPASAEGKTCQSCHMAPTGGLTNVAPGHGGVDRDPTTLSDHRMLGATPERLRQAVKRSIRWERTADGWELVVELQADQVGHRVPTGFIDRHLVLSVEGFSAANAPVACRDGPRLSGLAGAERRGRPGAVLGRWFAESPDAPAPFWSASSELIDTRLTHDRPSVFRFTFGPELVRAQVRLEHHRFWPDVARDEGWRTTPKLVFEEWATAESRTD